MSKIKHIVLDMGNVLIEFSPFDIVSRFTQDIDTIETLIGSMFYSSIWRSLDEGTLDEEEAKKLICKKVESSLHPIVYQIIDEWYQHIDVKEEILPLIKQLKEKGYGLYLLSNASERFYDYKDQVEAMSYLDGILISADVLVNKPDFKIYDILCQKFSLNPDECLFIDDMPVNIKAAIDFGMHGYLYQGNIELLTRYLKRLAII